MFTGRYEPIPGSGQLNTPTTGESMMASFKADYLTPFLLTPGMETDKRKELSDRVGALRMESERADGTMQRGANWVAGMAGSILNPYSLLAGEGAGALAKPLVSRGAGLVGKYLPSESVALLTKPLSETLGKTLPEFVGKESAASLTGKAVSGFAMGTGFALPSEVANTYDPKTDAFNWQGGIKASFEDGGIGLALMSVPFLAGTIWGKVFKGGADHSKMPLPGEKVEGFNESHVDQAVQSGWLTHEQGQWFKDYAFQGDTNDNLAKRATEMLIKNGHPVDSATNQVMFKILHPDDVNNLQTAVADRMASNLPDNIKTLYQDFINHSRIDDMRAAPNVEGTIDGLKGIVSFVRKRLEKKPEELVNFQKMMKQLLPNSLNEKNPFTQRKLMRGSNKAHFPNMTIPIQVEKRIKQMKAFKKYYRGSRYNPEVYDVSKMKTNFDYHFGHGYWFAELKEHAKHYGKYIEKIEGDYNLYDTIKGKDKVANKLLDKIINPKNKLFPKKRYGKLRNSIITYISKRNKFNSVKKLHNYLKKKGYEGLTRLEGAADSFGKRTPVKGYTGAKTEVMFFEKPKHHPLTELLTHKEEMEYLRDRLLPEGKLSNNFKSSLDYRRLLDLTLVRNDARRLMHEVHLKHECELHEAYATLLDTITKVMRSEFGKLAKTENINDYMRERIQSAAPQFKDLEITAVKKEVAEARVKMDKAYQETKTAEGREGVLKAMDEEMNETPSSDNKKEYDEIKNQYTEFKENENVFSSLIKCVLGATNV